MAVTTTCIVAYCLCRLYCFVRLCTSPSRVIKSRRRWAGHVARRGRRDFHGVLMGTLEERNHFECVSVDGTMIILI